MMPVMYFATGTILLLCSLTFASLALAAWDENLRTYVVFMLVLLATILLMAGLKLSYQGWTGIFSPAFFGLSQ